MFWGLNSILCKSLLLFHYANMASGHTLYIFARSRMRVQNNVKFPREPVKERAKHTRMRVAFEILVLFYLSKLDYFFFFLQYLIHSVLQNINVEYCLLVLLTLLRQICFSSQCITWWLLLLILHRFLCLK